MSVDRRTPRGPGRPPVPPTALEDTRWPALADETVLLLVPVGSLEQHGPHLPLGTDTLVAAEVAHQVARQLRADRAGPPGAPAARVLVAPPVAYGASGEHEGFPGTVSVGHDALCLLLLELGRSACRWADRLVFVNGHGGNATTVAGAVARLREEGRPVAWTSCATPGGDAHAGHTETSLLRHLAPWSVRMDLAVAGATEPVESLMPRLRERGVRAVSPNGVLGDPTTGNPDDGASIFSAVVRRVHDEVVGGGLDPTGRLRGGLVPRP